jgi:hypothetical protein
MNFSKMLHTLNNVIMHFALVVFVVGYKGVDHALFAEKKQVLEIYCPVRSRERF